LESFSKLKTSNINLNTELDLYVWEQNQNISWISNIRGASSVLNLRPVTEQISAGMIVLDFDKDEKEDVLSILGKERQVIAYATKTMAFHKPYWNFFNLFAKQNVTDLLGEELKSYQGYRISSFIAVDLTFDGLTDLVIGLDLYNDQEIKTALIRCI